MVQYRIRSAFRIAAWIPALAFAFIGIAFGLIAIKEMGRAPIWSVAALVLFGLLVTVLGFLFGKIAWTGRVSAAVEEYGVDDPKDIERMRATARLQGRLEE